MLAQVVNEIPLQLLEHFMVLGKEYNMDMARNIAKGMTAEQKKTPLSVRSRNPVELHGVLIYIYEDVYL